MDARLEHIEFVTAGYGKGEHGLRHLVGAIGGIIIPDPLDATDIINEIAEVNDIKVLYNAERLNLYGRYHRDSRCIVIYGRPRLATILHEAAHHVAWDSDSSHGFFFKGCLYKLYVEAEFVLGLDILNKGEKIRDSDRHKTLIDKFKIAPNATVRIKGDENGIEYRVVRHMTKNCMIESIQSGRKYRIQPKYLEVV